MEKDQYNAAVKEAATVGYKWKSCQQASNGELKSNVEHMYKSTVYSVKEATTDIECKRKQGIKVRYKVSRVQGSTVL